MPRDEFDNAITLYYAMMGWNPQTGVPTRAKLEELGLGWLARYVKKAQNTDPF
ncbi:MAG: hypothetical protein OEW84_01920 [Aigarchaeota archaeon]|nr:hypothetical protein [Aigarchaeota archaeon]